MVFVLGVFVLERGFRSNVSLILMAPSTFDTFPHQAVSGFLLYGGIPQIARSGDENSLIDALWPDLHSGVLVN